MKQTPRARSARLALATVGLTGCEGLIGFDFDAVEACRHAAPNPRPDLIDAGGDIEVTAVVIDAQYGDGLDAHGQPRFLSQGYDLDGLCTGAAGPASCTPPAWVGYPETDGSDGRDNGVGRMFSAQDAIFGLTLVSSEFLAPHVESGEHAPNGIVRVRGYNGLHEDDHVEVDWFVAVAPGALGKSSFEPAFDGSDVWPLHEDTLDPDGGGSLGSIYRDTEAYVGGYQLVARFPRIQLPLANVYFEAHDVVLTSQITKTGAETRLQKGMLAGVIPTDTFLEVIPLTSYAITEIAICPDSTVYPDIKRFICVAADVPLDRPSGGDCDGGAFGIAFETAPVTLGAATPPPVLDNPCETQPDSCSTPPR